MKAPYPKSWWVEEGSLLAGCYPGDMDSDKAKDKLLRLLNAGVRCFVSLQEPGETGGGSKPFKPYIPMLKALAQESGVAVDCVSFPIRDAGVPDNAVMRTILDTIQTAVSSGRCVYVHCWGGHGRTGTVVGCWLRERGVEGAQALERIRRCRSHDAYLASMPAPQTPAQREMVRRWIPPKGLARLARAQGCLLGQLAGDALGGLVEFRTPEQIRRAYPKGVRELADGGTWNTIAGQPTDDSEMALLLGRMLVERRAYDADAARESYVYWLNSGPFDCGATISSGLQGHRNPKSQANGAMMRISPLGIFGANYDLPQVAEWASQDAALTHPNSLCQQSNALFAMAIAHAIRTGPAPQTLHRQTLAWAEEMGMDAVCAGLKVSGRRSKSEAPDGFIM